IAASIAGFIAQYPLRTGFAVAAASVIGYFAISSSPDKKMVSSSQNSPAPQQVQPAQNIPQAQSAQNLPQAQGSPMENKSYATYKSHRTYKTHEKQSAQNSSERIPQNQHGVIPPEKDNSPKQIADAPNNSIPANNQKENIV